MGLGGGLLVPGILRFYWARFNGGGFAIGTTVGLIAAVLNRQIWALLTRFFDLGEINDWKLFVLMLVIGLIATIIGTYLTRPTDKKVLENFYKTTRPFGFWGHMKPVLSPDVRAAMTKEHRNDLLALPFTLGWQITLFLLPMQLIIRSFDVFWITFAVFVICLTGMYFFWYRNLPLEQVK